MSRINFTTEEDRQKEPKLKPTISPEFRIVADLPGAAHLQCRIYRLYFAAGRQIPGLPV
jgi:hypothetical protein